MDPTVLETPTPPPAQALAEPRARPPNAIATPTIACRRVGPLVSDAGLFLSFIIVLPNSCIQQSRHKSTVRKYDQDNISLGRRTPYEAYFSVQRTRRAYALPHRSSRGSKEKHH